MIKTDYLLLVVGMGLVTYIPRWVPLFFLSRRQLPLWFIEWLDLIPAAILSALISHQIFTAGEPRQLELFQLKLWVAIPTFLFALKTRSLVGTVLVGMLIFWLVGKFL